MKTIIYNICLRYPMAYRLVQSLQFSIYFFLSVLNSRATSGTRGSSGLGSVISAHIDNKTEKWV